MAVDLIASNFTVSSNVILQGETLDFTWVIANIGTTGTTQSEFSAIYMSTDPFVTTDDTLLHYETFPTLGPGQSDNESESDILVLPGLAPGTYYLRVIADDLNDVTESNEFNNGSNVIQITVLDNPNVQYEATIDTISDYLTTGYWEDRGSPVRSFNVTSTGIGANNGVILYNLTGFSNVIDPGGDPFTDLDGITGPRADLVRAAMDYYSDILGVTFVETTLQGDFVDIYFTDSEADSAWAWSDLHAGSNAIDTAFINIGTSFDAGQSQIGQRIFSTIVHEVGHIMGLGHSGNYNGSGVTYEMNHFFSNDTTHLTIMSYFDKDESPLTAGYSDVYLLSLAPADILALQKIYGAQGFGPSDVELGDTTYGFNSTVTDGPLANLSAQASTNGFTIVDGGGVDTVDFSGFGADQLIDLTVTQASDTNATTSNVGGLIGNMVLAVGTVIENATGGFGSDIITGNAVANTLNGGFGADQIFGAGGNDILIGGAGNDILNGGTGETDIYVGGSGADHFVFDDVNGQREFDLVFGFEAGIDTAVVSDGFFFTSATATGLLVFYGADFDIAFLAGTGITDNDISMGLA